VYAAIHHLLCFNAVPNNSATTMLTGRGQAVDGAFETIKCMPHIFYNHLKGFVIFISTGFTLGHDETPKPGMVEKHAPLIQQEAYLQGRPGGPG
jgi:hypothetical protein